MVNGEIHKDKPNWLLYFLIAASLIVHAGIFLQASGRFTLKKPSYIEVGVRKETSPKSRQIPRPRVRPAANTPRHTLSHAIPDYADPVIEPVPDMQENLDFKESVPESVRLSEDIPEEIKMDVADFSLPEVETAGGFGSRMDYLDMVRLKIESRKEYPPFSRQRSIEGMVTVEFVIGPDGYISGLRVVESSGFPSLDTAAVSAVNNAAPFSSPPEKYFNGQVRVKVPIAFELIQ